MIPFLVVVGALFAFVILGWVLIAIWLWERIERAGAMSDDDLRARAVTTDLT